MRRFVFIACILAISTYMVSASMRRIIYPVESRKHLIYDYDRFVLDTGDNIVGDVNITGNLVTTGSGTFENVHISSGETFDTILEADNTELSADRTLTFDLSNASRKLMIYANEIQLSYSVLQDLATTARPTFADVTISSPSNIYSLDHDSFSGYVADEHIDWTDSVKSLSTSGTVSAISVIGAANGAFGTLTLANGSITDSGGSISFGNEALSTTGNISTSAYMIATRFQGYGDADTYQLFTDNQMDFYAGGVRMLLLDQSIFGDKFIVNPGMANLDFCARGDTDASLLYCNADTDRVGIGDNAPGEKLDVAGNINVTGVYKVGDASGVSGTFEDNNGNNVTVTGGIITDLGV